MFCRGQKEQSKGSSVPCTTLKDLIWMESLITRLPSSPYVASGRPASTASGTPAAWRWPRIACSEAGPCDWRCIGGLGQSWRKCTTTTYTRQAKSTGDGFATRFAARTTKTLRGRRSVSTTPRPSQTVGASPDPFHGDGQGQD